MSVTWITVNSRLTKGISIINSLPTKKFQLLLAHIVSSRSEDIFSTDELEKLKDSLKLIDEDLKLLIQSINYIIKQSSRVLLRPTSLEKHFKEHLKLDEDKSEVFTKVWSEETVADIGSFEQIMELNDLTWEKNIEIANQICNEQEEINARLQLSLSSTNDSHAKDKISLTLGKDELLQLYNTLEAIQIKLDNMNS